jgi:stage II sporulation protein D
MGVAVTTMAEVGPETRLALAQTAPVSRMVRIGVAVEQAGLTLSGSVGYQAVHDGKTFANIAALEPWQARRSGSGIILTSPGGKSYGPLKGKISLRAGANGGKVPLVFAQRAWYRGNLDLIPGDGGTVTAVNVLPLEEYLFGVVPGEMPASWEREALKAQAIAARTYALHNLGKESKKGYDLCGTTHCQVYEGAAVEVASTNEAVANTAGEYLAFDGKPIQAYFHASSGGYTDNAGDIWSQDLPYIRAVADFDQASPRHVWHLTYSESQVAAALDKIGVNIGRVLEIAPQERTSIGRVKTVRAKGTGGSATFEASKLRFAIGLHSTFFNVGRVSAQQIGTPGDGMYFQFAGRGWGHGLGMSQWGARGMADRGFNYKQILNHFYPGSQLRAGTRPLISSMP